MIHRRPAVSPLLLLLDNCLTREYFVVIAATFLAHSPQYSDHWAGVQHFAWTYPPGQPRLTFTPPVSATPGHFSDVNKIFFSGPTPIPRLYLQTKTTSVVPKAPGLEDNISETSLRLRCHATVDADRMFMAAMLSVCPCLNCVCTFEVQRLLSGGDKFAGKYVQGEMSGS